ncbi:MAG: DUF3047 domain-containing protein [Gemmatimonadota bacterium]
MPDTSAPACGPPARPAKPGAVWRRRARPVCAAGLWAAGLALTVSAGAARGLDGPVAASSRGPASPVRPGVLPLVALPPEAPWLRRDWNRCRGRGGWRVEGEEAVVSSDSAAVLYWLIPGRGGLPVPVKPGGDWLRRCERPPLELWQALRERDDRERLLVDPRDHSQLSWQWRMQEIDPSGLDSESMVSLGVTMVKRGTQQVREINYLWSRQLPVGAVATGEKVIIPGIWKHRYGEIVVRSGTDASLEWQGITRDLAADYRALYPGEQPGKILRVFVKVGPSPGRGWIDVRLLGLRLETEESSARGAADGPTEPGPSGQGGQ